jgi:hypothetical protein
LIGLGLGAVSREKDVGLKNLSICLAPSASAYLAKSFSFGLAANSSVATSIKRRNAMKVIWRRTTIRLAELIHVIKAPNFDAREG